MRRLGLILSLVFSSLASGQSIGDFFKQAFEEQLRDNPQSATGVGRRTRGERREQLIEPGVRGGIGARLGEPRATRQPDHGGRANGREQEFSAFPEARRDRLSCAEPAARCDGQ